MFAWAHLNIEGIDLGVMSHRINIDPSRMHVK